MKLARLPLSRLFRSALPFAATLVFIVSSLATAGTWYVIKSFDSPYAMYEPSGLAWDGSYLWHGSWSTNKVCKIDPQSGTKLAEISTGESQEDMTFLKGFLWVADNGGSVNNMPIRKYNIGTLQPAGVLYVNLSSFPSTSYNKINGVANDGQYLWVNYNGIHCIQIDPENGKILHSWTTSNNGVGNEFDGMEFAWDHLFIVTNNAVIYEIDPCSGTLIDQFSAPSGIGWGPEGITFDGEYLWYADFTSNKIYQIGLKDDYQTKTRATAKTSFLCTSPATETAVKKGPDRIEIQMGPNPLKANTALKVRIHSTRALPSSMSFQVFDIRGALKNCLSAVNQGGLNDGEFILQAPKSGKNASGYYFIRFNLHEQTFSRRVLILG